MSFVLDLIVRFVLLWTITGSVCWIILDQCGVIENGFEKRRRASGRPVTLWFAVGGSVAMILVWPLFAAITWRRRKEVLAKLKRVVWR